MADEIKIAELAGRLFNVVKTVGADRVSRFIEENEEAKAYVSKQTRKMAELALELAAAPDAAGRDAVRAKMERVEAVIDTELLAIANDAVPEAKDALKEVLKAVWGVAKEVLPTLVAALLKRD